jgi:Ras-related protein Rab-7A
VGERLSFHYTRAIINSLHCIALERWRADFLKQSSLPPDLLEDFPLVLIGNKIDIDDRVVSRRQARAWAQQHSSPRMEIRCFEASAKDGTNVEEAFSCIAGMVKIPQLEFDMDGSDSFQLNRRDDSLRNRKSCAC